MKRITKLMLLITMLMITNVTSVFADELEKPIPADCQLESGLNYYLYLPSQEKFLSAKETDFEPTLATNGSLVTFVQTASGDWTIHAPSGYFFASLDVVICNGNEEEKDLWYIEKQASGAYLICPSKDNMLFPWSGTPDMWMGLSYEYNVIYPALRTGEGDYEWRLVPEASYDDFKSKQNLYSIIMELQGYGENVDALINTYNTATSKDDYDNAVASVSDLLNQLRYEHASDENPFDATSLFMQNPSLSENFEAYSHDVPGWTLQPSSFLQMRDVDWITDATFYDDRLGLESGWHPSGIGDGSLYQKLSGLRNGKYRFSNNGQYVYTADVPEGEQAPDVTGAYIYAKVGNNVYKQPLNTGWGYRVTPIDFECYTEEAEVGIMFEGTNVGYCVVQDFKLEYLGIATAADRLNSLIEQSQELISGNAINASYIDKLNDDITQANAIIASGDEEAQESLYATFNKDYEDAVYNRDAYVRLATVFSNAEDAILKGESEAIEELSDYMLEKDIDGNMKIYGYNNSEIDEIISNLEVLIEKAINSIILPGTDITDLLVNGHFDTSGGWIATQGGYSIDKDKKIMSQWWNDWSAEQVLTNVPNGTYRMEVQGFYWASWDWSQSESDWNASDKTPTALSNSKIKLNDSESLVQNVWACGPTDIKEGYQGSEYFVPNSESTAKLFFDLGLYENMVETTVTDNTLKITFDCSVSGFWNCFTNLRLTYIGVDIESAKETLYDLIDYADDYLLLTISGEVRKAIEDAKEEAESIVKDEDATFDQVNNSISTLQNLFTDAVTSSKDYEHLASVLNVVKDALTDEEILATEAGKELQTLYQATKADYDSEYPTLDSEGITSVINEMEELMVKAKQGAGIKEGDDITKLIANASFENTYGNEITAGGDAVHNVPYGWSMLVDGQECLSAQDMYDAGINSWTAIEENNYTTDGNHSYCLLSAPTPDCYLYQDIKGLPAGTYRVSVDMAVPYDGGCSRLTGQRLLVNNVAQYYGKPEYYYEDELNTLHPEEVSRTFAGYDEVNYNETGEVGDMGNMQTLTVEVYVADGESLTLGVRTDNNKSAMNRNYEENWWDCCGRYKIDNFRLVCVSLGADAISDVENDEMTIENSIYDLQGRRVYNAQMKKGIYIINGKKIFIK